MFPLAHTFEWNCSATPRAARLTVINCYLGIQHAVGRLAPQKSLHFCKDQSNSWVHPVDRRAARIERVFPISEGTWGTSELKPKKFNLSHLPILTHPYPSFPPPVVVICRASVLPPRLPPRGWSARWRFVWLDKWWRVIGLIKQWNILKAQKWSKVILESKGFACCVACRCFGIDLLLFPAFIWDLPGEGKASAGAGSGKWPLGKDPLTCDLGDLQTDWPSRFKTSVQPF